MTEAIAHLMLMMANIEISVSSSKKMQNKLALQFVSVNFVYVHSFNLNKTK